ncbi:MAG: class I SAM-dependent methyltransferase [Proteobacteria bacterium]|nr:class I SAM-dependent methyltransferase [Pseudomonadota bacterium]MBS0216630.1 class I SAM-dependent methyltransferase [Pseudomonadota bacterium]
MDASIRECRGRVLDIGAADGWLASRLHEGAHYISVDYPVTAMGLYGTRPHVYADACCMPIADESIDAVACYEVMEHVSRPDDLLAEVARVLAPGGVAEFTMPFFYPIHDAPHDYQRWTRHGWARGLKQAGLDPESIEARGHSLHAAATTLCLGLAGPFHRGRPLALLVAAPVLMAVFPVVNLTAWIVAGLWPSWDAMSIGYRILARKPGA